MEKRTIHPDQMYIDGLASNNSAVIQSIYKKFVPKVVAYIKNNSGDEDQAQDVVQEIMILLFNQAKANALQLTCPFDAYFFLLCKRKWLNELKKTANKGVTINEDLASINESTQEMIVQTETFDEKQQLFDTMFQKLGDKCKELLQWSFTLKTMEEVAEKLQVTYGYVRKKKSLCVGQLTQWIQEAQVYKSLKK
ncbi:sigma-70 family RNA polymerase sigma factor [Flavobacterium sp. Fl-77]|uniref:Sigma-70 family RNA polymerase sigma factor n=1 Tax=Flavobacterium flavipigmentatum TaxID=2893884 RepID=A0AAJ2S956_9FLAO|nr:MULTISPECIES: sigma-70 family RNA polymerase sigma factor [unclassified Flavobacterium]MDX6181188.1 sigma-70 family RNA polymerase sigma factor [Flavobacterium sp. Fl-33]MDX6184789.1 sigma-70 family RNA polymerase sigma factor [Flavobacterium sp. Fl-77]UFH39886.1 sigma-70 family RNA polymerase sigma factor [Flavobacterium sp. F-70]